MKSGSVTIPKDPKRPASRDFLLMRRESIENIANLGGEQWTDYNAHDPGITLLESLLFTINDLAYRAGWDIKDLLANVNPSDQAFFKASRILTVNPVTPDDYRRLLIDLPGIRNAWVVCKECTCGEGVASVKGLYDIRIELDADDTVGDLNDRVITARLRVGTRPDLHEVIVEVRFPQTELSDQLQFEAFLALDAASWQIECIRFMRSKTSETPSNAQIGDEELRKSWRNVFYATLLVKPPSSTDVITIEDVAIRFFTNVAGKNTLRVKDLTDLLTAAGASAIVGSYQAKEKLALKFVESAKAGYHAHRNLDEDLCRLSVVGVSQVAVCAEIEVAPDADIEWVQASVWLAIEQYLEPSIPFYSLDELRKAGAAVEEIFDGPTLANGFIKQADLDAAGLRGVVRASDIVNLLMDIAGVRSLNNLLMTLYDDEGNTVKGSADPTFANGKPEFDLKKVSASWLLYMGEGRQPRLYHHMSNFKFRKNGLPLTVDQDEAYDTLTQLRGAQERPKQPGAKNDLDVPAGRERNAADLTPVQYLLPFTYGVSADGLPGNAGVMRLAQARQLKGYLMVFEQLLGNAFEQVAHLRDLFSTSPGVAATYFPHDLSGEIDGYAAIVEGLDAGTLSGLCESGPEFLDRRNAFLDHLMARFGLNFRDYALMLKNWKGDDVAKRELIADKLGVLAAYPEISGGRARAFNHRALALAPAPRDGTVLKRRVALLLGYADLRFVWTCDESNAADVKTTSFTLLDVHKTEWASGTQLSSGPSEVAATRLATCVVLQAMSRADFYELKATADGYRLVVSHASSGVDVTIAQTFASVGDAKAFRDELLATAGMARSMVVEHLLLRPKFPGDAVYKECAECDDADPWSFRLTVVMPGWTSPYNDNLDWRDFANRTIQEEIPSHLLPKICWVGDDDHDTDHCDPVINLLTKTIENGTFTEDGIRPTCEQALPSSEAVYAVHEQAFRSWYDGNEEVVFGRQTAATALTELFSGITAPEIDGGPVLSSVWSALQAALIEHFADVMLHGYQLTRFEKAWNAWLTEDSGFDWGEERIVDRVHAILKARLQGETTTDLCACAEGLVEAYGKAFSAWRDGKLDGGSEPDDFQSFTRPAIALCKDASFLSGTDQAIAELLDARYATYVTVSYRLAQLVRMLESLTNTYPRATLHDCDDGGDDNPVRLNQTALGSLSTGTREDAELRVEPVPTPHERSAKPPRRRKR